MVKKKFKIFATNGEVYLGI